MIGTMNSAARIALAYFSALPLQRWTNGAGLALIVIALSIRALATSKAMFESSAALAMMGSLLLLLPILMGGAMMRAASTRILLHHRPAGRLRMVLGATLAITLSAAVATPLITLLLDPFAHTPALHVFATTWGGFALAWLTIFITSGNRLLSMFIGFVPLVAMFVGRNFSGEMPGPWFVIIPGITLWTGFSFWYLRADSVRRPIYSRESQAQAYGGRTDRVFQRTTGGLDKATRSIAFQQYLLGMSYQGALAIGVLWATAAAALHALFSFFLASEPQAHDLRAAMPFLFVPVILIFWSTIGFWLVRRARMLWLRGGRQRPGLFRLVERSGLACCSAFSAPFLVGVSLYAKAAWSTPAADILVLVMAAMAFLVCVFYGSLSLTRGLVSTYVLFCCLMPCVLAAVALYMLRPWGHEQGVATPVVIVALLVLASFLRWQAARQWLKVDWRAATLPRMLRGGA